MEKNKVVLIVVLAIVALMFLLSFFMGNGARYSDDEPRPCTEDSTWSDVKKLYSPEPRPCTEESTWSDIKRLWG
ncbi:hypothetical protein HOG16_04985 [Candidatus Woesearchaeota archaeon]|jgi:hypothetical protein|nr:hypothetical protein [Candidatus Woesearchaeota archaeon]MBT4321771.1 hypothetical protein [Candidatus Woesearchaeota archaeon]MBT4630902.1 hypothetical protein [Candidatus Woesearchaeota archaeon]